MKSIHKLSVRRDRVRLEETCEPYGTTVRSSATVAPLLQSLAGHEIVEVFLVVMLDAKNKITGYAEVARGGQAHCAVGASEVFRAALLGGAYNIIIAHNHPSGDPTPSAEDIAVTKRLVTGAKILGLGLLDHIIIGHQKYYSFLDSGVMPS